jgi:hypothetical protein
LTDQERDFAQRGKSKATPSRQPKPVRAYMVIPPEKEKQDQHDNEGGRFEERDAE